MNSERYASTILKTILSLAVFVLGGISQVGTDWVLVRNYDGSAVASWFFFRSVVFIGGTFVTLGFERLILRADRGQGGIMVAALPHLLLLSALGWLTGAVFISPKVGLQIGTGLSLYSLSLFLAELHRSKKNLFAAQLSLNFWRVMLLAVLSMVVISSQEVSMDKVVDYALVSLLIGVVMSGFLVLLSGQTWGKTTPYANLYRQSTIFLFFNLLLVGSTYGDQLLLSTMASPNDVRIYAAHSTVFLAPLILISSFFGFLLGAYARRILSFSYVIKSIKLKVLFLSASALIILIASLIGRHAIDFCFSSEIPYDPFLVVCMVLAGIIRIVYALPSAILGVLGNQSTLRIFLKANAMGMLFQLILVIFLTLFGVYVPYAIGIAYILNWAIRSYEGLKLVSNQVTDA